MKTYWLIAILLIASCAPAKTATETATTVQKSILTARPVATLTLVYPPPTAKLTTPPVASTQEVNTVWEALAGRLRVKAQQAKTGSYWEDLSFKEEAYQICDELIAVSSGQLKVDSQEIFKRWRWGMEFMNHGELDEVIRLIDQHN